MAALLAGGLAGCPCQQDVQRILESPLFIDVAAVQQPHAARLTFTPASRTDPARCGEAAPSRPARGSTVQVPIGTTVASDADIEVTLTSQQGRVTIEPSTIRVGHNRPVMVRLTATGVGEPGAPGDVIVLRSPHGDKRLDIWIEPTEGQWRDMPLPQSDLGIVAVHASLMRADDRWTVLFFSPPRKRAADGSFELDHHGHGGGFAWDMAGLGHMEARVWDLSNNDLTATRMEDDGLDGKNLFCSGHAHAPDGSLVIAGGHSAGPSHDADLVHFVTPTPARGTAWASDDPAEAIWARSPDKMLKTRWYPTVTTMADGKLLVTSGRGAPLLGHLDADNVIGWYREWRREYELYDPATRRRISIPDRDDDLLWSGDQATYPSVFMLPGNRVFVQERNHGFLFDYQPGAAPRIVDSTPGDNDPTPYRTRSVGSRSYPRYGSAVLLPFTAGAANPLRLLVTGGQHEDVDNQYDYDGRSINATREATHTAEIFDYDPARGLTDQPGWRAAGNMLSRRVLHDATLLADGNVLISGGSIRGWGNRNSGATNMAELFDPDSETFREQATACVERRYHSTALLLPDGTVVKAGSTGGFGDQENTVPQFSGEIFRPGYLWRGPRPVIQSSSHVHGQRGPITLTVQTKQPTGLRLALIRLGSTTHGNNMDQRFVWLPETARTATADGVTITADIPALGAVLPPGDHMLVAVDGIGVPSLARYVNVSP